jgi:hypothetical protein
LTAITPDVFGMCLPKSIFASFALQREYTDKQG